VRHADISLPENHPALESEIIMEEDHISEINCAEKCAQVITDCMKDGRDKDQCQILYRQCVSECIFAALPYA
jgi:hypothetical protein